MAAPEPILSSEEDEDEEGPDEVLTRPPAATCLRQRASVSAEAFGEWNKRGAFTPPIYPKTPEQLSELTVILSGSFLFAALEAKDMQQVVLAMKGPLVLEPGHRIITEGSAGDHLYVITEGALDCSKVLNGIDTVVKTCLKGDLFGELALLYNSPRAASVMTREASVVWELDRETFNHIVMEAVQRKRTQCTAVLRKVPLFQAMSESEVETIIDALKMEKHATGTVIITQGEIGHHFYIVYEGQVTATKLMDDGSQQALMQHEAGDYFGELALLQDQPRAATVIATSEVCLLSMDRSTFKRLMGPVEEFLKRGASRYD